MTPPPLLFDEVRVQKTHALGELGHQCLEFEPSLQPVVLDGATLSEYASQFRYPGAAREIDQKEAEDALAKAARVFDEILKLVPPQARPL